MLDPSTYINRVRVDEALAQPPQEGKRNLEPFAAFAKEFNLPISILEDSQITGNVEVHRHESDLWLCLEGEVTFVCDGRMKDPKVREKNGIVNDLEIRATEIIGGKEYILHAGDWLLIPAGQPHQHKTETTARLAVIKIPAKTIVPLEQCM